MSIQMSFHVASRLVRNAQDGQSPTASSFSLMLRTSNGSRKLHETQTLVLAPTCTSFSVHRFSGAFILRKLDQCSRNCLQIHQRS